MPEGVSVLNPWSNFYVIVGSSAAGLTGLMFVVIVLAAGLEDSRRTTDGIATFSTPTVLHLCVALVVAALLSAPWRSLVPAGTSLGLTGLYGIVYVVRVMQRARRMTKYRMQLEEWVWYSLLPLAAYVAIVVGAILLPATPLRVLFPIAGAVLLLILVGIHNAWDIVTYLVVGGVPEPPDSGPTAPT